MSEDQVPTSLKHGIFENSYVIKNTTSPFHVYPFCETPCFPAVTSMKKRVSEYINHFSRKILVYSTSIPLKQGKEIIVNNWKGVIKRACLTSQIYCMRQEAQLFILLYSSNCSPTPTILDPERQCSCNMSAYTAVTFVAHIIWKTVFHIRHCMLLFQVHAEFSLYTSENPGRTPYDSNTRVMGYEFIPLGHCLSVIKTI